MAEFSLEPLETTGNKKQFFYLLKNGENLYRKFWEENKDNKNLESDFRTIISNINLVSQGFMLPKGKLVVLGERPKGDDYVEFEVKSKKIRLFYFEDKEKNCYIINGFMKDGKIKNQKRAIALMRKIKNEYLKGI